MPNLLPDYIPEEKEHLYPSRGNNWDWVPEPEAPPFRGSEPDDVAAGLPSYAPDDPDAPDLRVGRKKRLYPSQKRDDHIHDYSGKPKPGDDL